jgi:hypothetical protein
MELQEVFYTMGIIYMAVMFVLMIVVIVTVLVIKHKIHLIQRNIEEKLHAISTAVHVGEAIVDRAKSAFGNKKH